HSRGQRVRSHSPRQRCQKAFLFKTFTTATRLFLQTFWHAFAMMSQPQEKKRMSNSGLLMLALIAQKHTPTHTHTHTPTHTHTHTHNTHRHTTTPNTNHAATPH